jgi:hypothetical protein
MSDLIVVVDSSEIREGKLEELKTAIAELVKFVEGNESEPIAYNIYLDETGIRMTVVQIHPNSASMERHLKLAGVRCSASSPTCSRSRESISTASPATRCSSRCARRRRCWETHGSSSIPSTPDSHDSEQ